MSVAVFEGGGIVCCLSRGAEWTCEHGHTDYLPRRFGWAPLPGGSLVYHVDCADCLADAWRLHRLRNYVADKESDAMELDP